MYVIYTLHYTAEAIIKTFAETYKKSRCSLFIQGRKKV